VINLSSEVKQELIIIIVCALLGLLLSRIILFYAPKPNTKVINCELAEFHPDFTPAMKKACRNNKLNDTK